VVHLTAGQFAALRAVRGVWPDADLLLIGAHAIGVHIDMNHRETEDIDLAVAVGLDDFPGELAALDGWRRHKKIDHRFYSPQGQMVDVLPVGAEIKARGHIEWDSGHRMSVIGFDLAFAHAAEEDVTGGDDELTVRVPSAPALAFLKMQAWLDRPAERTKDIADLGHLLDSYIGRDDELRWDDDIAGLELDYEDVSPFVLGRDLGAIVETSHREHVEEFLAKITAAKLTAYGPWVLVEQADRALGAFRAGFERPSG
jgi:predicted nucleotidyltransferase